MLTVEMLEFVQAQPSGMSLFRPWAADVCGFIGVDRAHQLLV